MKEADIRKHVLAMSHIADQAVSKYVKAQKIAKKDLDHLSEIMFINVLAQLAIKKLLTLDEKIVDPKIYETAVNNEFRRQCKLLGLCIQKQISFGSTQ